MDQVVATGERGRDGKSLMASRLERAKIVVRGTFVGMRAGQGVSFPQVSEPQDKSNIASMTLMSNAVVMGDFKVRETLKGDASGTVQVLSRVGLGDCGAGSMVLGAIAMESDLSLELRQISKNPRRYTMDTCGYMENHRPNR